jgi:hypothetical protein
MNYTYNIFKWRERTFIQEFENDKKIQGAYVALSNVINTNNTYYSKSDLHYRIRKWLLEDHPELMI